MISSSTNNKEHTHDQLGLVTALSGPGAIFQPARGNNQDLDGDEDFDDGNDNNDNNDDDDGGGEDLTIWAEYPALRSSCGIVGISFGNPATEPGNMAKGNPVELRLSMTAMR